MPPDKQPSVIKHTSNDMARNRQARKNSIALRGGCAGTDRSGKHVDEKASLNRLEALDSQQQGTGIDNYQELSA